MIGDTRNAVRSRLDDRVRPCLDAAGLAWTVGPASLLDALAEFIDVALYAPS